jgi:hypothetical protein
LKEEGCHYVFSKGVSVLYYSVFKHLLWLLSHFLVFHN